jgi:hypothetical protein
MVQKQAKQVFGLGVACRLIRYRYRYRYRYRRRYRTDQPAILKLPADRVATLSELREHGHKTIEQCLLLAVVVCGQRFAHQRARPESQRTPAPSLVRFQTTGVDPRSSLCRYPRQCSARWPAMRAYHAHLGCAQALILRVTLSFHMLAVALWPSRQTRWPHARRRASHERMA